MKCPDERQLMAVASGSPDDLDPALEAHLDACGVCREVVIAIAAMDPKPAAAPAPGAPSGRLALVEEEPGRYEIIGECGRGGQSRVYRVFDCRYEREVALKELDSDAQSATERFLREVRIVGELAHPAIVPIHEVGVRCSGAPYYTMPLVVGRTLADVVADTPDLSQRLLLLPQFVLICQAVVAAHARGVIHRDIKPENIMIGPYGDAKLLDWGLSVERQPETATLGHPALTAPGAALGTPAYMSPEQARGGATRIDERSDGWGLGAVLYCVLARRPPFTAGRATAALADAKMSRPQSLRSVDARIPAELEAIVARAMEPDPDARYPTAAALADDVVAFHRGGRVGAYRYSVAEEVARFARRYRALLIATALVIASLVVALVWVARSGQRESEQRQQAEAAREQAQGAAQRSHIQSRVAMGHLARAHIEKAERLRDDGKLLRARVHAASSLRYNPMVVDSPYYDPAPAVAQHLPDAAELQARAVGLLSRAQTDAIVRMIDELPRPAAGEPHEIDAVVGDGGFRYAVAEGNGEVTIHGVDNGAPAIRLGEHPGGVSDVALSRSGRFAVSRDASTRARLWALPSGKLLATWDAPAMMSTGSAVSNFGIVATVGLDGTILLGDPASGSIRQLHPEPRPAISLGFSADGQRLAVGGLSGKAAVLDVQRGELVDEWTPTELFVSAIAFCPDDTVVATGGGAGRVVLHRIGDAKVGIELRGNRGAVATIAFAEDGTRLFTASQDGEVRGYDTRSGDRLFQLEGPGGHVYEVGVTGTTLVAFGSQSARRWRLRPSSGGIAKPTELSLSAVKGHGDTFTIPSRAHAAVGFVDTNAGTVETLPLRDGPRARFVVPTGNELVVMHDNGELGWWSRGRDHLVRISSRVVAKPGASVGLAVCPDGSVAATEDEGRVALIPRAASEPIRHIDAHQRSVLTMAFSPDGTTLATGSYDGGLALWRVADGARIAVLRDGPGTVMATAFIDAQRLVAAGRFGVQIWTSHDAAWSPSTEVSAQPHRAIAIDPTGKRLAAIGFDRSLNVWTLPEGRPSIMLRGERAVQSIVFAAHGDPLWLVQHAIVQPLALTGAVGTDPVRALARAEADAGVTLPLPGG